MRTVLFLVLFVMLASLVLHHPPLESLLFAVALAVGLTPEFLPMIMRVTLAQGAVHMARQQVIVKHLAAIEDFGSMDVQRQNGPPHHSLYDGLTFGVLLWVFYASEALFHTGWFVESLATQNLVLFVIRTAGHPCQSRPSLALATTTRFIVLLGLSLPFTPLARVLGFVPLPGTYFLFLAGATLTYRGLVEVVKRRLLRRMLA